MHVRKVPERPLGSSCRLVATGRDIGIYVKAVNHYSLFTSYGIAMNKVCDGAHALKQIDDKELPSELVSGKVT